VDLELERLGVVALRECVRKQEGAGRGGDAPGTGAAPRGCARAMLRLLGCSNSTTLPGTRGAPAAVGLPCELDRGRLRDPPPPGCIKYSARATLALSTESARAIFPFESIFRAPGARGRSGDSGPASRSS